MLTRSSSLLLLLPVTGLALSLALLSSCTAEGGAGACELLEAGIIRCVETTANESDLDARCVVEWTAGATCTDVGYPVHCGDGRWVTEEALCTDPGEE